MIVIREIGEERKDDINIKNEPFELFGVLRPSFSNGVWRYTEERTQNAGEMRFPDEEYDYELMKSDCLFIGAYDGEECVGLAILQKPMFKYIYLYDIKVSRSRRAKGVGQALIEYAKEVAKRIGYKGIYTIAQDNNLGACKFYLKCGFEIGGLDTMVYSGTSQEGKADIYFYYSL